MSSTLDDKGVTLLGMIPTFSERVQLAVDAAVENGHSVAAIAAACGISNKAVYQWRNGSSKTVKATSLVELADLSGYQARWLATGKGRKVGLSADEIKIVDAFHLMGPELRDLWLKTADDYLDRQAPQAKAA